MNALWSRWPFRLDGGACTHLCLCIVIRSDRIVVERRYGSWYDRCNDTYIYALMTVMVGTTASTSRGTTSTTPWVFFLLLFGLPCTIRSLVVKRVFLRCSVLLLSFIWSGWTRKGKLANNKTFELVQWWISRTEYYLKRTEIVIYSDHLVWWVYNKLKIEVVIIICSVH